MVRSRACRSTRLAFALGAAALHAFWNVVLARERDVEAATALAVVSVLAVLALPAALTWRVEADAIPYIVASGTLELIYFALLAAAYCRWTSSASSTWSPAASRRCLALLLVVAVGGARPATLGIVGVLVVSAGVLLVRGPRGDLRGLRGRNGDRGDHRRLHGRRPLRHPARRRRPVPAADHGRPRDRLSAGDRPPRDYELQPAGRRSLSEPGCAWPTSWSCSPCAWRARRRSRLSARRAVVIATALAAVVLHERALAWPARRLDLGGRRRGAAGALLKRS